MHNSLTLAAIATTGTPAIDIVATTETTYTDENYQIVGLQDSQAHDYIFLVPQHEQAYKDLKNEVRFTQQIVPLVERKELPFDTLRVRSWVPLPTGWHGILSDYLPINPVTTASLSQSTDLSVSFGKALAALHSLPEWTVVKAGLKHTTQEDQRQILRDLLLQGRKYPQIPSNLLSRWEKMVDTDSWWNYTPRVTHGDFSSECFHYLEDGIVSLRNLGQVQVGDPAIDLAWVVAAAPVEVMEVILSAYETALQYDADRHLRNRAEIHSELAVIKWFLLGVNEDNSQVQKDALNMLQELAHDIEDEEREQALLAAQVAETIPTDVLDPKQISQALNATEAENQSLAEFGWQSWEQNPDQAFSDAPSEKQTLLDNIDEPHSTDIEPYSTDADANTDTEILTFDDTEFIPAVTMDPNHESIDDKSV